MTNVTLVMKPVHYAHPRFQTRPSGVTRLKFVWVEGPPLMKGGWRYVWTTTGGLSVTMAGTYLTPRSSADSLATGLKVGHRTFHMYTPKMTAASVVLTYIAGRDYTVT